MGRRMGTRNINDDILVRPIHRQAKCYGLVGTVTVILYSVVIYIYHIYIYYIIYYIYIYTSTYKLYRTSVTSKRKGKDGG